MSRVKSRESSLYLKPSEDWIARKWRPMMAWLYMVICAFDFMIAPILWSVLQAYTHGSVTTQWDPLTLKGAGLFHISMGAVLGVSAWGRTKEKMAGATFVSTQISDEDEDDNNPDSSPEVINKIDRTDNNKIEK